MNIWFLVWLCLAGALMYFFGWTLFILLRQKRTWKAYAAEKGLRYAAGKFSESPEMNGPYKHYTVSLFTGDHVSEDVRGVRKLTAVEVQLTSRLPFEGGIATGGMVDFIRQLGFNAEITPAHEKWRKDYIALSSSPFALEQYLTGKRMEALLSLMRIKNAWVILVFKQDMALLRFDTPDPLDSARKLDAIVNRMVEAAAVLELEPGEEGVLKKEMNRTSPRQAAIHVPEEEIHGGGLSLEDDEPSADPESQS